jgi:arylsulfatase A-like enzyme
MHRTRSRSVLLFLVAVAAMGTVTPPVAAGSAGGAATRPDIVFVMGDDMRGDEMEAVAELRPDGGFAWVRDHGVRTGLWFGDNLCCPSRTTILTGQTAFHHGVLTNARFPELGRRSLPVWMRDAGYCTGFVGRYLNKYDQRKPRPPGWRFWEPLVGSIDDETGYAVLGRNGRVEHPGRYITDHLGAAARSQLDDCREREEPAFVALWTFAPHFGSDPKPEYAGVAAPWTNADPSFNEADVADKPVWLQDRFSQPRGRPFYEEQFAHRVRTLLSVDDALGALIADAEARGALDDTVFVLTSDNGWFLGEHRVMNRKELPYEAGQSSLWIAGPGFPAGVDSDAFVHNTDLAPTLLRTARATRFADPSRQLDGVPLQALLREGSRGHDRFLPLYVPVEAPQNWPRPDGRGVRTWRYKFVRYADGSEELYDLLTDPNELENRSSDPAFAELRTALTRLSRQATRCRGDACRVAVPPELQE